MRRTRITLPALVLVAASTNLAFVPGRGSFERTLKVSGPVHVDVLSEIGGITLRVGAPNAIRIRASLSPQYGPLDLALANERIRALERNPPIEQSGDRIRIGYPADPELLTRISMRLEIEVPPTTVVRARTSSGGIQISGIDGRVDGESRSGRIVISNITGDVSAKTHSGGVVVHKSQGQVVVQNGSGAIDIIDAAGAVEATNGSGAIRLSQIHPAPIRAYARSGAIRIDLAPGAGYDYLARSEKGRILISDVTDQKGKNLRHKAGKLGGGGPLIDVSTDSSSVSIER